MNLGASDYCEQFGQLVNLDPSLIIICAVVSSYRGASRSDVTKLSDWEVGAYLPIFCVEAASLGASGVSLWSVHLRDDVRDSRGFIMGEQHVQAFPRLAGVPRFGK